jgi:hypothetical protein
LSWFWPNCFWPFQIRPKMIRPFQIRHKEALPILHERVQNNKNDVFFIFWNNILYF